MNPLRVLVVDDSAYNRRTIAEILSAMDGVEVVGKATDGDEALKMVSRVEPDLITLDLEMPRMDGFKFLRLLMARRATPVIVVSGYANKENVFRALELGALDFIPKPTRAVASDLKTISELLKEKVALVRQLAPASFDPRRRGLLRGATATGMFQLPAADSRPSLRPAPAAPRHIIVVAASTGGPTALVELFARMPSNAAVVVVQHMPERFTHTFAQRLDRLARITVREASGTQSVLSGTGWVCPGGRCIELERQGTDVVAKVVEPRKTDRYVPSADRLFESAGGAAGDRVIAVVLTGMGDDGARGIPSIKEAGGRIYAEGPETAVIYGMPGAAVRTGKVDRSLPLPALAEHLAVLVG